MWEHSLDWMSSPYWGWYGAGRMLIWPLIIILVIAGLFWFARSSASRRNLPPPLDQRSPALDVLEDRYARGEIDRDEYLQKKRDICG